MTSESKITNQAEKLKVLCHRQDVKESLIAAFRSVERGDLDDIKRHLNAIQQNVLGFEQYLSATLAPKDYAEIRLSNSTTAAKVFAVPELLESILQHLDVPDLMRCYGVNRTFRDALENSKKLQTCLCLLPDMNECKQRFPLNTKQIQCTTLEPYFGPLTARINIRTRVGTTYKIGSRWKKMLVRQPPMNSMEYHAICYGGELGSCLRAWNGDKQIIQSSKGLTIADLFEAVETTFNVHSGCATSEGEGSRNMVVYFDGPAGRMRAK